MISSISNVSSGPRSSSIRVSKPLSGQTKIRPPASLAATLLRLVPTPGSTTITKTVSADQYGAVCRKRYAPSRMLNAGISWVRSTTLRSALTPRATPFMAATAPSRSPKSVIKTNAPKLFIPAPSHPSDPAQL